MQKLFIIPLLLILLLTGCSYYQQKGNFEIKENQNETTDFEMPDFETEPDHEELIDYLYQNVPEIQQLEQRIMTYAEADVYLTMYVEAEPDPNSKYVYDQNYYRIYVGEDHQGTRQVNVYRFLINKDTKEILHIDPVTFEPETLDEWRSNQ